MQMQKTWIIVCSLAFAAYFATYLWLSRRGYEYARLNNIEGFYYIPPDNAATWRAVHIGCTYLYWPLNLVDRSLGTGRHPGCEPLFDLD